MQPEIIGAYIGAGASIAVGIIGLLTACIANSRAKKSNSIAQAANNIAVDALAKAAEANSIAADANKLSEEANAIASSSAAKQFDPSHVDWMVQWDSKLGMLRITNDGRDVAHNVSILIKGGDIDQHEERAEPAPRGTEISIPLPKIVDDRAAHNIEESARLAAMHRQAWIGTFTTFVCPLEITILWNTELGNPRTQQFELSAS